MRRPADEDRAGGRNTLTRFAAYDEATPNPNADLIGKSFTYTDGWKYTVTSSAPWSDQYVHGTVTIDVQEIKNVTKPAALVRERIASDSSGALPGA